MLDKNILISLPKPPCPLSISTLHFQTLIFLERRNNMRNKIYGFQMVLYKGLAKTLLSPWNFNQFPSNSIQEIKRISLNIYYYGH